MLPDRVEKKGNEKAPPGIEPRSYALLAEPFDGQATGVT